MKTAKSILIVEDELLIARQLKTAITKHGYSCAGIAIDYMGVEDFLKHKKADIVLLDITLSGTKTGLDIAEMINKEYGIPFLFITSYNDPNTLVKIKHLNPKGYINKPVNEATLLTTLDIIFSNLVEENTSYTSISIGTTTYNIHLSELLYIEAEHVYVRLYFKSKTTLIRSSLKNFIDLMPEKSVVQISRGVAVNPSYIEHVGATSVKLNGKEFKRSKNYEIPS